MLCCHKNKRTIGKLQKISPEGRGEENWSGKNRKMNLFYLDVETTGFDTKKNEVIELAFAIEVDGVIHLKMNLFLKPDRLDTIKQEALSINGWSIDELKKLPDRKIACDFFCETIEQYRNDYNNLNRFKIIEYSNGFDLKFMRTIYLSNDQFCKNFGKESINVLSLAKKKLPKIKPHSLKSVARALGINVDDNLIHGAAYDRDILIKIYNKLKLKR